MTATVRAILPAPVRHVPAKSRQARTSYAQVVADLELRELTRDEAPRGPDLPVNNAQLVLTRLVDGAIWRPIGSNDAFGEGKGYHEGQRRIDGSAFRSWLAGDPETEHLSGTDLAHCLEGTPLLARIPGQRDPHRPTGLWNTGRQGEILLDTRDTMPTMARDYVAANVALVSGMPFMRMPGPMAYVTDHHARRERTPPKNGFKMQLVDHPGGWTTNPAINMGNLYRADRLDDLHRVELISPSDIRPAWNPALLGTIPENDDDIMLMLREAIRIFAKNEKPEGYPLERVRLNHFHDLSALNSVGAITDQDLPATWRFVRDFASSLIVMDQLNWVKQEARRVRAYADALALPRLERRPGIANDDTTDLAALAPF